MRYATAVLLFFTVSDLSAAEYRVGPGQPFTSLQALLDARNLAPGDVVRVDGDHTYPVGAGVVVREDDSGSVAQPVVIRGERINGRRPVLQGGTNTIKFQSSDHVVLEGFEITGGSSRCVFHDAHEVTLRDVLVYGCPNHGVHTADLAGSLTIEYSELRDIGSAGNDQKHTIYAQTGELAHPGAVFRLRHSYVHSGLSGNLVKSRAQRTELHYNWIESADVQEVEMLSPDPDFQEEEWSDGLVREDGEMVGNVVVHTGPGSSYMIRLGGDGTGAGSAGLYRLLNNTFVMRSSGTVLRLFAQLRSVDAHNNVFSRIGGSGLQVFRDVEAEWVDDAGNPGARTLSGSNNFVDSNATSVPAAWIGTRNAANAGFVDAVVSDYSPSGTSPLLDQGNALPSDPPALPFPQPSGLPQFHPVRAALRSAPARVVSGVIDIGGKYRVAMVNPQNAVMRRFGVLLFHPRFHRFPAEDQLHWHRQFAQAVGVILAALLTQNMPCHSWVVAQRWFRGLQHARPVFADLLHCRKIVANNKTPDFTGWS